MEDTKESTKVKSKVVTSRTAASRHPSDAPQNTPAGSQPLTDEAEELRNLLARILDVMNSWPCREANGQMVKPLISTSHILFALPVGRHVIKNTVTSSGKQNFAVDDVTVIPESVLCDGG